MSMTSYIQLDIESATANMYSLYPPAVRLVDMTASMHAHHQTRSPQIPLPVH